MTVFSRFPERLQHAIAHHVGWSSLRPVQELAGEAILDGKNAVVLAPTAGGKTEAAIFPILAELIQTPPSGVGALYVAPIKALLNNQKERLGDYTEMVGLRSFVWHGDAAPHRKDAFCREPAELLMTTPESLEVMLMSPRVPAARLFKDLRFIVVDEVHAFAGTDRGAHLASVCERLAAFSEHDVQRIGLSATVGNPEQIAHWLAGSSERPSLVIDPPKPKAQRLIKIYLREDVRDFAREAVREGRGKKSLFFCQSRSLTEAVADEMRSDEIDVFVHHGSVSKEERLAAEEKFAHGTNACIVATSTLELGIDVGGLDLTFQANAPSTVSSFLQRMGRTGRREGTVANMTFLCDEAPYVVQSTALVLLAAQGWVENVRQETRAWPVLVHQILAMTQEHGGVSTERCWRLLQRVPDFRDISEAEYLELVEHMKRDGYLFEAGGLLSMGSTAERVFGRKNFLELYAVFSSPVLYKVQTESKRDLGSLEQNFVDRLVEEMSTFLLGGRAWLVVGLDHEDRLVRVRPAPRGKKPSWGGFIPQFLGFEVCQEMKAVLVSDEDYPFLDEKAKAALSEWRSDLGTLLRRSPTALHTDGETVTWWTFAGGRINQTLKYAVEWRGGWKVIPDNFAIKIQGDGATLESVTRLLDELRQGTFWSNAETRTKLLSMVPEYRLSKFQRVLPDQWQVEMVGGYLLDFEGTGRWLAQQECQPERAPPVAHPDPPRAKP
jgi:ATP-dependent helicase Lhr and Lhr-like helicase